MLRIVDERDVPNVPPYKISLEAGPGMTQQMVEIRRAIIKRIINLKAAVLNGPLIDLIDELDLRDKALDQIGHEVKIKGNLATYKGQYLLLNYCPPIDELFLSIWQARSSFKLRPDDEAKPDRVVVEELDKGNWVVRIES